MLTLTDQRDATLQQIAAEFGTPCYVYFWEVVEDQVRSIRDAFGDLFSISYAVKSNPNPQLLAKFSSLIDLFDVSSGGEMNRLLTLGEPAERITFSGPAKSTGELQQAVEAGCEIVCESPWELESVNQIAAGLGQTAQVMIRINPLNAPKGFSVSMAKKASQFGIDEENLSVVLQRFSEWKHVNLLGLHVYSGTNLLDEQALIENFRILIELFRRFCAEASLHPQRLVFGAGFGIPYEMQAEPLDLTIIAQEINPALEQLKQEDRFRETEFVLETGRYLIGPAGYFLMSVLNEKESRGKAIRICNGGMHNHLAACNLMGSIIRRNWPMWKLNAASEEPLQTYWLVGPLCTTIDTIAYEIELPQLSRGDHIAIGSSGAYGLTSSPLRFISHPEPKEVLVQRPSNQLTEISTNSYQLVKP